MPAALPYEMTDGAETNAHPAESWGAEVERRMQMTGSLDRQSPQPLHLQFEELLREQLDNEEWPVHSCIPSENELSRRYGISRMTVRAVLTRLVDAGLLYRVPGKGTFVAEPKIVSRPLSQMGITQQLEQMGYETTTRVINIGIVSCPSKIARRIGVKAGEDVYTIKRLRFVKGEPLSIHTSYIPLSLCSDLEMQDFEHNQLCDIMEQTYHYEIVRRCETLESTTASLEEAELLEVKPAFPLLLLNTTMYTHGDRPIECSVVVFRGDKFKIKLEFNKGM